MVTIYGEHPIRPETSPGEREYPLVAEWPASPDGIQGRHFCGMGFLREVNRSGLQPDARRAQ
jgi:hypothetical protein